MVILMMMTIIITTGGDDYTADVDMDKETDSYPHDDHDVARDNDIVKC